MLLRIFAVIVDVGEDHLSHDLVDQIARHHSFQIHGDHIVVSRVCRVCLVRNVAAYPEIQVSTKIETFFCVFETYTTA